MPLPSSNLKDLKLGARVKVLSPSNTWVVCVVQESLATHGQLKLRCDSKAVDKVNRLGAEISQLELPLVPRNAAGAAKYGRHDHTSKTSRPSQSKVSAETSLTSLASVGRSKSDKSHAKDERISESRFRAPLRNCKCVASNQTDSYNSALVRGLTMRPDASARRDMMLPARLVPVHLRIALYTGPGTSETQFEVRRVLRAALHGRKVLHKITSLSDAEISAELSVDSYDVVIFPGGRTCAQLEAFNRVVVLAVRTFVRNGGGFIGICAGGVLALECFEFFGKVFQKHPWDRGMGDVTVEFTDEGLGNLHLADKNRFSTIFYGQGPIVSSHLLSDVFCTHAITDEVKVLAHFRSEICYRHTELTKSAMIDTPAIFAIRYGLGRVLVSSVHPELAPAPRGAPHLWVGTDAQIARDMYYGFLAFVDTEFFNR